MSHALAVQSAERDRFISYFPQVRLSFDANQRAVRVAILSPNHAPNLAQPKERHQKFLDSRRQLASNSCTVAPLNAAEPIGLLRLRGSCCLPSSK
jgi:hypothetical protein